MATEKQIEANRKNSARSTGPKTVEGKARSRVNAIKHGLAGVSTEVEASVTPEYRERRAKWSASLQPVDELAEWAVDRAVAASFRIEKCERAVDRVVTEARNRAVLSWDEDRAVEAAEVFARLGRDPILASRQLQTTRAGVALLIEAWLLLAGTLESGTDWSEAEASRALDFLGIGADLRSGRMMIHPPEGEDPVAFRLALAFEEVDRLEALRDESLTPLDEMEQSHAIEGDIAILSKPARLVLRYEREAWKRYNDAMKELKSPATPPAPVAIPPDRSRLAPVPVVAEARKAPARPAADSARSFEEERRAIQAEAAPYRQKMVDELVAEGFVDEDAWLDEMERRIEAYQPAPRPKATEQSQSRSEGRGRLVGVANG